MQFTLEGGGKCLHVSTKFIREAVGIVCSKLLSYDPPVLLPREEPMLCPTQVLSACLHNTYTIKTI